MGRGHWVDKAVKRGSYCRHHGELCEIGLEADNTKQSVRQADPLRTVVTRIKQQSSSWQLRVVSTEGECCRPTKSPLQKAEHNTETQSTQ